MFRITPETTPPDLRIMLAKRGYRLTTANLRWLFDSLTVKDPRTAINMCFGEEKIKTWPPTKEDLILCIEAATPNFRRLLEGRSQPVFDLYLNNFDAFANLPTYILYSREPYTMLTGSFIFSDTPEGHAFWQRVAVTLR